MSDETTTVSGRAGTGRDALVEAAKRLLPDRAPSTIAGRELAAEAGVNYGLVHHYFGGKDGALAAGLRALRDDFVDTYGDVSTMALLTTNDPYLKALVRSNIDYPDTLSAEGEFPLVTHLVESLWARMDDSDTIVEAKARAIAMASMQLCFAVFGPVLLDTTGARGAERSEVEAALAALYDSIALIDRDEPAG